MKESISLRKEIGNEQQVKTRESNNWILALQPPKPRKLFSPINDETADGRFAALNGTTHTGGVSVTQTACAFAIIFPNP